MIRIKGWEQIQKLLRGRDPLKTTKKRHLAFPKPANPPSSLPAS